MLNRPACNPDRWHDSVLEDYRVCRTDDARRCCRLIPPAPLGMNLRGSWNPCNRLSARRRPFPSGRHTFPPSSVWSHVHNEGSMPLCLSALSNSVRAPCPARLFPSCGTHAVSLPGNKQGLRRMSASSIRWLQRTFANCV